MSALDTDQFFATLELAQPYMLLAGAIVALAGVFLLVLWSKDQQGRRSAMPGGMLAAAGIGLAVLPFAMHGLRLLLPNL